MITTIYDMAITNRASEVAALQYAPQVEHLTEQLEDNKSQNAAMQEEMRRRDADDAKRKSNLSCIAQGKSDAFINVIWKVLISILRTVQFSLVLFVLYSLYNDVKASSASGLSFFQIISAIFAFISAVDYFVPKMHFLDKWVRKFANYCGDWIYNKEMENGKRYIDV